jgi:phospholipid transport system substrate-binding protein
MKKVSVALAVLFLALTIAAPARAGEPTDELRRSTERIVRVLEDPRLKGPDHRADRRAAVRQIAEEMFDVTEAARRALGPHWQSRTSAERAEFVRLFADLLERAWVSKIDLYGGERVRFTGESVDGDRAIVRGRVVTTKGTEVPTEARMLKRGDRWVIYDIVVENVSLLANYRAQFDRVIRTASYDALVKRLQAQTASF